MPTKRLPSPPYNPGVKYVVEQRRKHNSLPSSAELKEGFLGWFENGYLPHRDEPGLVQFVTFRLVDSLPAHLKNEWEPLLQIQDKRNKQVELEKYLDSGKGKCLLRNSRIANLVQDALLYFHQQRYELRAWVIMPNHVHVLFRVDNVPMWKVIDSWKSYTAKQANQLIDATGSFWQAGYWDTYMRDSEHERRTVRYIENNPWKASLARLAHEWPWSSARYRDQHWKLVIPNRETA